MPPEKWMDRDRFNKGRRDLAIRQVGSSWADSMERWAAQMVRRSLRHKDKVLAVCCKELLNMTMLPGIL